MGLLTNGSEDFKRMVKSHTTGDIVQTSTSLSSSANKSAFKAGKTTVAVVGTAVQLHANLAVPEGYSVLIRSLDSNTSKIRVGDTQANAQNANTSYEMQKNDFITLRVTNLNKIWIDADVIGEGVNYVVESD